MSFTVTKKFRENVGNFATSEDIQEYMAKKAGCTDILPLRQAVISNLNSDNVKDSISLLSNEEVDELSYNMFQDITVGCG